MLKLIFKELIENQLWYRNHIKIHKNKNGNNHLSSRKRMENEHLRNI